MGWLEGLLFGIAGFGILWWFSRGKKSDDNDGSDDA
jgi:hypothetical protein